MHPRLHGADRHVEHLRDLLVRHVLHVGEHERDAELLGDRGEGRRDVAGAGDLVGVVGRRRAGLVLGAVVGDDVQHRPATLAAQLVVAGVHRDPVQPGGERRVAAEPVELAQHREERVLRDVGGGVGVAEDPQAHGVHALLVPSDESGEGLGLARPEAPDEVLVALGLGHGLERYTFAPPLASVTTTRAYVLGGPEPPGEDRRRPPS